MMKARATPSPRRGTEGRSGLWVDFVGGPVIDPTDNVKALNYAAQERQDDLRQMNDRRLAAEIGHLKEVSILRAEHAKEIRGLESDRLDKIRQVDVLAGNTAADRALVAIQTLAATTTANAETLRAMVASTATSIATQTTSAMAAVNERIALLEKSSYERTGKQAYSDPAMLEMIAELKSLRDSRAGGAGKSEGSQAVWGYVVAAVGLVFGAVGIVLAVMRTS